MYGKRPMFTRDGREQGRGDALSPTLLSLVV